VAEILAVDVLTDKVLSSRWAVIGTIANMMQHHLFEAQEFSTEITAVVLSLPNLLLRPFRIPHRKPS